MLLEALAFIDSSSSFVRQDQCSSETEEEVLQTGQLAVRKRKRLNVKSELERLRRDVQTLETTLAHVRSRSLGSKLVPSTTDTTSVSVDDQLAVNLANAEMEALWMDMAVTQRRGRQQSEATNRLLKRSLARQLKVAKHLQELIVKRTLAEDREASSDPRLGDFRHLQSHSQDDELVFAHLLIQAQQLYATMDVYLEEAGLQLAHPLALQTTRMQDSTQRVAFQTVSCSVVPLSVHQTDDLIWNGFFKGAARNRLGVNEYVLTEHGLRKNYLTTYQHLRYSFELHSRTVMRKYKENSRVVYTWTTVTVLASKGLRFLTQAMVIVEPSPSLPLKAAVIKKWLRFGGEQIDSSKLSTQEAEPLMEGILKALESKTTTTWSWLENNLVCGTNVMPPCAPKY